MQNQKETPPVLVLRMDRVKELCETSGIGSLRELAGRIGVDQSTLWRIENNIQKPSPGVIARIKRAFPMVSFDELIEVAA